MNGLLDFSRFSTYVNGIIDNKVRALASVLIGAVGAVTRNVNGQCERRGSGVSQQWGATAPASAETSITVTFPVPFEDATTIGFSLDLRGASNAQVDVTSIARENMVVRIRKLNSALPISVDAVHWTALGR